MSFYVLSSIILWSDMIIRFVIEHFLDVYWIANFKIHKIKKTNQKIFSSSVTDYPLNISILALHVDIPTDLYFVSRSWKCIYINHLLRLWTFTDDLECVNIFLCWLLCSKLCNSGCSNVSIESRTFIFLHHESICYSVFVLISDFS